jgi:dephospho-CoA kinase
MSNRWPGKYVIGLTGNIATGKSVVRKMLEHLGAFSLDADALSHQAIARGGPAYAAVVKRFGEWLLNEQGEINRARLARVVFSDAAALAQLEDIIHPLVSQAVDVLIRRTRSSVVVVEAIKLIESGLANDCDALWVVTVPENVQEARLIAKRKMSPAEARQRIAAQAPQAAKLKAAVVTIDDSGTFENTWNQVQSAFNKIIRQSPIVTLTPAATLPAAETTAPTKPLQTQGQPAGAAVTVRVRRGMPSDATNIASFIKYATQGKVALARSDVIAAFGDKAYMLADYGGHLSAIAGWKVENLVARVDEMYVAPNAPLDKLAPAMLEAVENASSELQSEAALVFVPQTLAKAAALALAGRGFAPSAPDQLRVAAWSEAARESMPPGASMLFKKLRDDRVLRPI